MSNCWTSLLVGDVTMLRAAAQITTSVQNTSQYEYPQVRISGGAPALSHSSF